MIVKTNTVRNAGFQRSCDHDQVCNCFLTFVIRAWNALIARITGKKGGDGAGFGVGGLGRGNGVTCPDGAGGGVGGAGTLLTKGLTVRSPGKVASPDKRMGD